jgi:predicted aspartyl protease
MGWGMRRVLLLIPKPEAIVTKLDLLQNSTLGMSYLIRVVAFKIN